MLLETLTPKEVAEKYGCTVTNVQIAVHNPKSKLAGCKCGGRLLILATSVSEWREIADNRGARIGKTPQNGKEAPKNETPRSDGDE